MKEKIAVYWARRDLRLRDNPALYAAVQFSKKEDIPLLPIFILEEYMISGNPREQFGLPSRIFLSKALPSFAAKFNNFHVIEGKVLSIIKALAESFEIKVFVNEDVHKDFYSQIKKIKTCGIDIALYADSLTIDKEVRSGTGGLYSVFTPFKNAVWSEFCKAKVLYTPPLNQTPQREISLNSLKDNIVPCAESVLMQKFPKSRTFKAGSTIFDIDTLSKTHADLEGWYMSEDEALRCFDTFLKEKMEKYKEQRDSLDSEGTSRMSLALAWGLVSARTLRERIQKHFECDFSESTIGSKYQGPQHYISELIWREFYKYLIFHNPKLMDTEFQERFRGKIKWVEGVEAKHRFEKWIRGETGYPIVDAAMMEIAKTGYMHNRARMIAASILTKNLGIDWRWGQEYFRAALIDLDEASNNGGWQWGASVGADPKPIRIFNPYLQAENFDKDGLYQKKYLGEDYFKNPPPLLIDHKEAREEALRRYGLK